MLGNRVLGQCPGCVGTGTARLRTLASQLVYPYTVQKQGSHLQLSLNTNFQGVPIQECIVVAQETRLSLLGHIGLRAAAETSKKYQRE